MYVQDVYILKLNVHFTSKVLKFIVVLLKTSPAKARARKKKPFFAYTFVFSHSCYFAFWSPGIKRRDGLA